VLGGSLDWGLIGLGGAIGVGVIIIDEMLRRTGKRSLPPLAVGMGIYLPMSLTLLIPVGAVLGRFYNQWAERAPNPAFAERLGVLMATGLIVGESLFGVAFAAVVGATNSDSPLALVSESGPGAVWIGVELFTVAVLWLYYKTRKEASLAVANDGVVPPREAAIR